MNAFCLGLLDKSLGDTSDIISDSSGVGTNSESATCSIGHPSTTVVCIEKYESKVNGHLAIQPGDVIEIVGSTDCGLLEGYIRGTTKVGFFPSRYAQEVQFRQKTITNVSTASTNQPASNIINNNHQQNVTTNGSEFEQQQAAPMQQYNSSTAPRAKKKWVLVNLILPFFIPLHGVRRLLLDCMTFKPILILSFLTFFPRSPHIRRLLLVSWCLSRVQWWVEKCLCLWHFIYLLIVQQRCESRERETSLMANRMKRLRWMNTWRNRLINWSSLSVICESYRAQGVRWRWNIAVINHW